MEHLSAPLTQNISVLCPLSPGALHMAAKLFQESHAQVPCVLQSQGSLTLSPQKIPSESRMLITALSEKLSNLSMITQQGPRSRCAVSKGLTSQL